MCVTFKIIGGLTPLTYGPSADAFHEAPNEDIAYTEKIYGKFDPCPLISGHVSNVGPTYT